MSRPPRFRGQPVVVLLALFSGWVAMRMTLGGVSVEAALFPQTQPALASREAPQEILQATPDFPQEQTALAMTGKHGGATPTGLFFARVHNAPVASGSARRREWKGDNAAGPAFALRPLLAQVQVQRQQVQPRQAQPVQARPAPAGVEPSAPSFGQPPATDLKRLSGDAWVLLRADRGSALSPAAPSYGRSQAGAVLRYRLTGDEGPVVQAYARASTALSGAPEAELAVGLSVRPSGQVPLRLAAELRATDSGKDTALRPSTYAVTELAPFSLPLGVKAEIYGQAGYVGGRNATAFADGQLKLDRTAAQVGGADLRLGAGAWGGAQKGAARLDAGPSLTGTARLGRVNARLAVDYRFRIAGDAMPSSGPSLTLAASF